MHCNIAHKGTFSGWGEDRQAFIVKKKHYYLTQPLIYMLENLFSFLFFLFLHVLKFSMFKHGGINIYIELTPLCHWGVTSHQFIIISIKVRSFYVWNNMTVVVGVYKSILQIYTKKIPHPNSKQPT